MIISPCCVKNANGILAQLVEHLTFNQVVPGSNPGCLTSKTEALLERVVLLFSLLYKVKCCAEAYIFQ